MSLPSISLAASSTVALASTVTGSPFSRSRMLSAIFAVSSLVAFTEGLPGVAHLTHWLPRGEAATDPDAVPARRPLGDPAARGPQRRAASERVQAPRRREGDPGCARGRALRRRGGPELLQRGAGGVPSAGAADAPPDDEGRSRPGRAASGRAPRSDGEARPGAAVEPPADAAAADEPDRPAAQVERPAADPRHRGADPAGAGRPRCRVRPGRADRAAVRRRRHARRDPPRAPDRRCRPRRTRARRAPPPGQGTGGAAGTDGIRPTAANRAALDERPSRA